MQQESRNLQISGFYFYNKEIKMKFTKICMSLALVVILFGSTLAQMKLNGAGATFPYVIYSKWFDVYSKAAWC